MLHRHLASGTLIAAIATVLLVVAGCGSGAGTATFGGGGSGSASASDDGAAVTAARTALAKLETRPTRLQLSTPIGKPIPIGKQITWVSCGNETCNAEGKTLGQIAGILGWTVKVLTTDGSPQQVQNAFQQAIREKTDAIAYAAFPRPTIENYIDTAQAAGIPVVGCCTAGGAGGGLLYLGLGTQALTSWGPAMATWVTAASGGTGEAVFVNTPEFSQITAIGNAAAASLKQQCPGCPPMGELDIPLTSIGQDAPDRVVSYLRAHPGTKYVLLPFDAAGVGVPTAIKAAGLTGIQILGNTPTPTSLQYLESGLETDTIATPSYEALYGAVDVLARHFAGVPVPKSFDLPVWIMTKTSVPDMSGDFPVIPDLDQRFRRLWGK